MTVLLAEDEALVAMDLQFALEDAGAEVLGPFARLDDLKTKLEGSTADVALLDIMLADGEVYPAALELQQSGVGLVFHSGHGEEIDLRDRFPDCKFCAKPASMTAVIAALQSVARATA